MIEQIKTALHCNDKEARVINELFEYTKKLDNNVQIQFKHKDFVGVGEANELLRFYLYPTKTHIKIKFKNSEKALIFDVKDEKKYKSEIKEINDYFKNNIMLVTETNRQRPDYKIINKSRFECLKSLANGVDPTTNEQIFTPSKDLKNLIMNLAIFVVQRDDINKKSFKVYRKYLEKIDRITKTKTNAEGYEKLCTAWTDEEEKQFQEEIKTLSVEEIAKNHHRSVVAIQNHIRLMRKKNKSNK